MVIEGPCYSRVTLAMLMLLVWMGRANAQQQPPVPRPFPQPERPSAPAGQAPTPEPTAEAASPPQPAQAAPSVDPNVPTEEMLGLPIYPTAEFLTSYDAGFGQRYYLFGTNLSYAEAVSYYRAVLDDRGQEVFDEPPTYMFETGRFDDRTMAFPPGVTIKDYTWGGLPGYMNPKRDADPRYFSTVIQIVPANEPPRR